MTYVYWPSTTVQTVAGDDIVWKFQVRDGSGVAVDITGWTFGFWAVDQHDATNIISVSSSDFSTTTPASGLGQFVVARATTLSQGGHVFRGSLWRTDSGSSKELASGSWKISRTVRP